MNTYFFYTAHGWNAVQFENDEAAIASVKGNLGIVRILNATTEQMIWVAEDN